MTDVVSTNESSPQELDLELVRRVQRGDSAAFDLLVRKYQHRIVALIGRYIHDWSECQDVAQDTFMRAYRAMGNFRGDAQFYTWLHRIAVNTAKNHLVAHKRRPPTDDVDAADAEQYDTGSRLRDTDTPEREPRSKAATTRVAPTTATRTAGTRGQRLRSRINTSVPAPMASVTPCVSPASTARTKAQVRRIGPSAEMEKPNNFGS